jgi:uncharacterized protein (DUF58 family)
VPIRKRFWIPYWAAPRLYWALTGVAILFALSVAAPPLSVLAAMCGATVLAALFWDAVVGPRHTQVCVDRIAPEPYALGIRATITYRVENFGDREIRIWLTEAPTPLLEEVAQDDRAIRVPARSQVMLERAVSPVVRGSGELRTVYVNVENVIGLLRRRFAFAQVCPIRVYPDLSAVERYGKLHTRNKLIETGLRRMRLRGTGTEAESVRDWMAGDPFRAINWKASARRGRMMVSEYEVERSQNVIILLDAGRLMIPRVQGRQKFDYAITAALSVASVASFANDKVGAIAFAADIIRAIAPRSGARSVAGLVEAFHDVAPVFEETDYDRAFSYVRTHVHKRSLVVFFTDMVDPVAQAWMLSGLGTLSRRHAVVCAFMNDGAIEDALTTANASVQEVYAAGVALELRDERQAAAVRLERLGVRVVDVPAAQLSTALIDKYLKIKERGLL